MESKLNDGITNEELVFFKNGGNEITEKTHPSPLPEGWYFDDAVEEHIPEAWERLWICKNNKGGVVVLQDVFGGGYMFVDTWKSFLERYKCDNTGWTK